MPPLYAGVDVGSSATKAVLVDEKRSVKGKAICESGMDFAKAGRTAFDAALVDAGADQAVVNKIVSSGYGRKNVEFASFHKTEIACHARGAFHYFPKAISIVDIGGQDNKIIKVNESGMRVDFKMNRKCAAGTGAFLEEIARRMDVSIKEMNALAGKSTKTVEIGSFCTVFSATEVLSLIRRGALIPDIAKGAFRSVIKRITEMDPLTGVIVATGGVVAHNPIVVDLLTEATGSEVKLTPDPQYAGALGAALYAADKGK